MSKMSRKKRLVYRWKKRLVYGTRILLIWILFLSLRRWLIHQDYGWLRWIAGFVGYDKLVSLIQSRWEMLLGYLPKLLRTPVQMLPALFQLRTALILEAGILFIRAAMWLFQKVKDEADELGNDVRTLMGYLQKIFSVLWNQSCRLWDLLRSGYYYLNSAKQRVARNAQKGFKDGIYIQLVNQKNLKEDILILTKETDRSKILPGYYFEQTAPDTIVVRDTEDDRVVDSWKISDRYEGHAFKEKEEVYLVTMNYSNTMEA